MQKRIIDEFRIEGLQNFNQYTNINPISIAITESEIQSKLSFYSKKYQYRFIVNNLLFSSSIQKDTNVIFIATNRLNDAKEALINGKMLQLIGVMNLSQIICWDNIKKTSHWAKAVFIDSDYPKGAQHFAFAFETTDLHNLLNFEYSLLEDEGKLVKFEEGEDKIPAINFTTHCWLKMLKVRKAAFSHSDQTKKEVAKLLAEIKNSIKKLETKNKKKMR